MSDRDDRAVRRSWERYLESGREPDGVRPTIAASWRRSRMSRVAPDVIAFPFLAGETKSRLVSAAEPVLHRFAMSLPGTDVSIVLADRRARIVGRWVGDAGLERRLTASHIDRGFVLEEEVAGTNGIGTVLEEMRPLEVVGSEHFVSALQELTCVGVPIRHPLTGRLEGVLDLACPATRANSLLLPTAIDLGAQIERELFERVSDSERSVLRAFLARNRETTRPVIALTDQVMMANASAAPWLDGVDQAFLLEQADMASLAGDAVARELSFSGGRTAVAWCRPVRTGRKIAGLLIEIDTGASVRRPAGRGAGPPAEAALAAAGLAGSSAAWRRVARLCSDLAPESAIRIEGEPGAGKMALARHLHNRLRPESACTVLPGGYEQVLGTGQWLRQVHDGLHQQPSTIVLAHTERLSAAAAAALCDVLDVAADTRPLVISTASPGGSPFAPLEHRLRTQVVALPPLRGRAEDIAEITHALLRRHARGPTRPRLAPNALRVLMRHSWPGNVRELETLLVQLLAGGRIRDITVADLPDSVRGAPLGRALGGLERLQCDAIVAALRDADANKTQAAAALGLSRSTLYRKIRQYGIDPQRELL